MLNPDLGQEVNFETTSYGFKPNDINDVQWDFGDGKRESNALLSLSHSFSERGAKVVLQTITLKNGKKMTNLITLYVVDKSLMLSHVLDTAPDKLNPSSLQNIVYSSVLHGDIIGDYITFLQNYDGTNPIQSDDVSFPLEANHLYSK